MSEPLSIKCDCLKRIEAKYIAIRNEAMEEQENISKVINENSPKYYLELIGLQHSKNCNGIKEIETYVAESKERLEIIRTTQGADALKEDITKWKQTWIEQRDKADKEIKEWVTSRLGELSGNSLIWYWAYVNSIEHLNSLSVYSHVKNNFTFNHSLTDTHFEQLANLINNISLFAKRTRKEQVQNLFNLNTTEPISVNHNPQLAWLFNSLKNASFIADGWQSIIEKNSLFRGRGNAIIKAKALSKYIGEVNQTDNKIKQITTTINNMKNSSKQ